MNDEKELINIEIEKHIEELRYAILLKEAKYIKISVISPVS